MCTLCLVDSRRGSWETQGARYPRSNRHRKVLVVEAVQLDEVEKIWMVQSYLRMRHWILCTQFAEVSFEKWPTFDYQSTWLDPVDVYYHKSDLTERIDIFLVLFNAVFKNQFSNLYLVEVTCASNRHVFLRSRTCSCPLWRHQARWYWGRCVHREWQWSATRSVHLLRKRFRVGKLARWTKPCFPGMFVHTLRHWKPEIDLVPSVQFKA